MKSLVKTGITCATFSLLLAAGATTVGFSAPGAQGVAKGTLLDSNAPLGPVQAVEEARVLARSF